MTITASAPGSVMITGEHAVVYGHPAIVCAIEQRVTVRLKTLDVPELQITSEIAPPAQIALQDLPVEGPYRFVSQAVALYRDHLSAGIALEITSQIDPTLGLGSSAAVTIATLGALKQLTNGTVDLHAQALGIVRTIQGRGSGADLAASLHGGMIAYQLPAEMTSGVPGADQHATCRPLPSPPQLSLRYAGYKTPTAEVLATIAAQMRGNEARFDRLYARMGRCAQATTDAALARDWDSFSELLQDYQVLMQDLGVSDPTLDQIITEAMVTPGVRAAKISGSGLGDCVVALGDVAPGFRAAPLAVKGLVTHD